MEGEDQGGIELHPDHRLLPGELEGQQNQSQADKTQCLREDFNASPSFYTPLYRMIKGIAMDIGGAYNVDNL